MIISVSLKTLEVRSKDNVYAHKSRVQDLVERNCRTKAVEMDFQSSCGV